MLKLCKPVIIATFTYSLLCVTGEQQEEELAALGLLTFAASEENGADSQSGMKTGPSLPLKKGSDPEVGVVSSKVV